MSCDLTGIGTVSCDLTGKGTVSCDFTPIFSRNYAKSIFVYEFYFDFLGDILTPQCHDEVRLFFFLNVKKPDLKRLHTKMLAHESSGPNAFK